MPLDDLQNFNSGFRVLNGDFPFRDYYSITGPILDIWQSNIYKIFGINWQSLVIHASLLNSIFAISVFFFLRKLNFQGLPNKASKFWVAEGKDLIIRYEGHTEFISLTLIYPNKIEINKNKTSLFDIKFLNILPINFFLLEFIL